MNVLRRIMCLFLGHEPRTTYKTFIGQMVLREECHRCDHVDVYRVTDDRLGR